MGDVVSGLVLYYSRTGHSRRAAETLADLTGADVLEYSLTRYDGVLGIARGMLDVLRKAAPPSSMTLPSVAHRPWVALVGPVWAAQPAPPLRAMLMACREQPMIPISLVLTTGDPEPKGCFDACTGAFGRAFAGTAHIPNDLDGTTAMTDRLAVLAAMLTQSEQRVRA